MKNFALFFAGIISSMGAMCQTMQEAAALYAQKKYLQSMEMSLILLKDEQTAAFANGLIGRIFVDQGKYDKAISYLQQAILLDKDNTYISGWSYAYVGQADIMTGNKEKGIVELSKAIRLNRTASSVKYAQYILSDLKNANVSEGLSLMPHWVHIDGTYITYYFQDTTNISEKIFRYVAQHEQAYTTINETFHAVLPQKMIFYVWNDRLLAKKILRQDLGFTSPVSCVTNAAIDQTIGHEMTHTLSYWGWGVPSVNITLLINEGVAVAFDQSTRDRNEAARKAIIGKNIHSILEIWKSDNPDESVAYAVGGAFLFYLYSNCTADQFKALIKNQNIGAFRKEVGKAAFNKLISGFDSLLGL